MKEERLKLNAEIAKALKIQPKDEQKAASKPSLPKVPQQFTEKSVP
jgi:hypothetical protein